MDNHQRREPRTVITTATAGALGALVLTVGAFSLGARSTTVEPAAAHTNSSADAAEPRSDTIDLVSAAIDTPTLDTSAGTPAAGAAQLGGADRKGLRARMLRALHATWVTSGKHGPVTHQAVRGDVTAVSATSITVRAKDGVSVTFAVSKDTTVRLRANGTVTPSAIGSVTAGQKALVTGVGATNPTARLVVHRAVTPKPVPSPSPSATS